MRATSALGGAGIYYAVIDGNAVASENAMEGITDDTDLRPENMVGKDVEHPMHSRRIDVD